jgi:hypothetical protein
VCAACPASSTCVVRALAHPKDAMIMSASLPVGSPPPPGFMECQKKSWFHTCREH